MVDSTADYVAFDQIAISIDLSVAGVAIPPLLRAGGAGFGC